MAKDEPLPPSASVASDKPLPPQGSTALGKPLPPTPEAQESALETVRCLRRFMFQFGFLQDKNLITEYNKLVDVHELGDTFKLKHVDNIPEKYVEHDKEVLPGRELYRKFERNFTGLVNFLGDDKPSTSEAEKHERNVRAMRRLIEEEISMQQEAQEAVLEKNKSEAARSLKKTNSKIKCSGEDIPGFI
jgi:hypothetical protein